MLCDMNMLANKPVHRPSTCLEFVEIASLAKYQLGAWEIRAKM